MPAYDLGDVCKFYSADMFQGSPHAFVGAFEEHRYQMPMHLHDFTELSIVLEGCCTHRTQNEMADARAGSVFVITPGTAHAFYPTEGNDAEGNDAHVINLFFHRNFFVHYNSDMTLLTAYPALFTAQSMKLVSFDLTQDELAELTPYMLTLCREYRCHAFNEVYQNALGLLVVATLCRMYMSRLDGGSLKHIKIDTVMQCIAFMNQNLSDNLTLRDLCRAMFCSPSSLRHSFEVLVGMSPMQYLSQLRLQKATELLQGSDVSLTEISQQCGFYDSAHFSRRFRAYAGISPKDYRKKYGVY